VGKTAHCIFPLQECGAPLRGIPWSS
jgi:hypothetical protein